MHTEASTIPNPQQAFLNMIPVEVVVELGRVRLTLRELAALGPEDVVELDQPAYRPLALVVGDQVIARGELIMHNDTLSLQITEIPSQNQG
ncbi:MAG: FliM/FliN family flagellar motor C-terminal domain-containing protein [Pseudomonadota bacterium]